MWQGKKTWPEMTCKERQSALDRALRTVRRTQTVFHGRDYWKKGS